MRFRDLGFNVWADVRYAFRTLKGAPGYAATLMLTLSLGLGAATTMLAIVNSVLLRPVMLPHPEQMVVLLQEIHGNREYSFSFDQIRALNERLKLFTAVSGYSSLPRPVSSADGSQIAIVTRVSPNFFRMLDVQAKVGRMFREADMAAPVAVVSDAFWHDRLHSDRRAIGSTIKVAGEPFTVVGIAPQGIHFPQNLDGPQAFTLEKMISQRQDSELNDAVSVAARLRPGISIQQAQEEARAVFSHMGGASGSDRGVLLLQPYQSYLTGDVRPALLSLFGGGMILLFIACGNAANLQIARGAARISEMTVRSALGASRSRLLQQIVTESVVVSLLGAAFGLLLSYGLVSEIRSAYGQKFPRFDELAIDTSTFFLCALLAAIVGTLASIAPATNVLRHTGTSRDASARTVTRSRVPGGLVVAQIALTCVLLIVTGLFVRAFHALQRVGLGFEPNGVTSMVLMPENPHQRPEVSRQLDTRLLERFAALPGVEAAALQSSVPFSNFNIQLDGTTDVNGRTFQKGDSARYSLVSANFVKGIGMHLLRGRSFLPQDDGSAAVVCLVNEAFVRKFLQGRDPIGIDLRFHRNPGDQDADMPLTGTMTVIGVLNNELQGGSLGAQFEPMVYLDYRQLPANSPIAPYFAFASEFAIRSRLPPDVLSKELRKAVNEVAPQMAELSLRPMEQSIADSLAERRLAMRIVSCFGIAALLLATIGIYGVLAYAVTQRRREIGIRMALGSSRGSATGLVIRHAATLFILGSVLGGLASLPVGHVVRSFLFGVSWLDPLTIAITASVLVVVCTGAATIPAWRAARVDPAEVLRAE